MTKLNWTNSPKSSDPGTAERDVPPQLQWEWQNWFKVSFLLHNANRMAQFSDLDLIEVLRNPLFVSICLEPQMVKVHHIKTFHILVCSVIESNNDCKMWCDPRFQMKFKLYAIETQILPMRSNRKTESVPFIHSRHKQAFRSLVAIVRCMTGNVVQQTSVSWFVVIY